MDRVRANLDKKIYATLFAKMFKINCSCSTPLERPTFGIIMIDTPFRIIKIISGESWEFLILQGKRYGGSYYWKAKAKQWDEETREIQIRPGKGYRILYATLFVKMFKINRSCGTSLERPNLGIIMINTLFTKIKIISGKSTIEFTNEKDCKSNGKRWN